MDPDAHYRNGPLIHVDVGGFTGQRPQLLIWKDFPISRIGFCNCCGIFDYSRADEPPVAGLGDPTERRRVLFFVACGFSSFDNRPIRLQNQRGCVGPGVVPRPCNFNYLQCQTSLTALTGAKGNFLRCQTEKLTTLSADVCGPRAMSAFGQ